MKNKPSLFDFILSKIKKNPRSHVLNLIPKNGICAELGVWKGNFSKQILKRKPKKIHLIDPWFYLPEFGDRCYGARSGNSQEKMDAIYRQVYKSFSNIPQVEIHRMKSEEAAGLFPNQYFDFIYIDGNHNYEFVKTDLINFSPKLKINGYICGDDYIFTRCGNGGPKRAVMEFTAEKIDFEQILPIQNNQFIIKRTIPM